MAPSWPVLAAVVLAFGLAIAALVVHWLRTGRQAPPKGQRGRLRDCAWCAALVAVAAVLTVNAYPALVRGGYRWWLPAIPLAAAAVVFWRPRMAAWLVPVALIAFGVAGLGLARLYSGSYLLAGYGVATVGDPSMTGLILAQSWAFVAAGGWLGWRELHRRPAAVRLLLGRLAGAPPRQRWALLMLPLSLAVAELVGSQGWFAVLLILTVASVLVLRHFPGPASRIATVLALVLGGVGLLLSHEWLSGTSWAAAVGATPAGATPIGAAGSQPAVWSAPDLFYGAVDATSGPMASLVAAQAVALLGLGCWLAPRTFPELRRLLGLPPDPELARRVQRLTESRAVAVDTAAADLRRLERDLHDGAQARLVALGMNLRAAERLIHTSPDAAAALIVEARETSARALTELRELVRGVHPPVLADRGLADAVRALALDSPLQVETDIDLPGRVPAPVETACYFAVAEVLTNAAKHSGARSARVVIAHTGRVLRIEVTDFGLGGADPVAGSGLAGVEKRLATFDGILAVSSPAGGPTIVVLEVPCALSSLKTSSC